MPRHFVLKIDQPVTPPAPVGRLWNHMLTGGVDYKVHYAAGQGASAQWISDQYDWVAGHYDVMGGGTQSQYFPRKASINPDFKHGQYDLLFSFDPGRVSNFQNWLNANGYAATMESAFLHNAGTSETFANRVTGVLWGTQRNFIDPGDAGTIAFCEARHQSLLNTKGDFVFIDETSSWAFNNYIPDVTLEYASRGDYYTDLQALITTLRALAPADYVAWNIGEYKTASDIALATVSGMCYHEWTCNPFSEGFGIWWPHIDSLVASGIKVIYGIGPSALIVDSSDTGYPGQFTGFGESRYSTRQVRAFMQMYGLYLMVVDAQAELVYFDPYSTGPYLAQYLDRPHSSHWVDAFEYDIGLPAGPRQLAFSGSGATADPADQQWRVYRRHFANAVVMCRPMPYWGLQAGGNYGDASAVTVDLPSGTWQELAEDGTLIAGVVTTVTLNMAETAIFIDAS